MMSHYKQSSTSVLRLLAHLILTAPQATFSPEPGLFTLLHRSARWCLLYAYLCLRVLSVKVFLLHALFFRGALVNNSSVKFVSCLSSPPLSSFPPRVSFHPSAPVSVKSLSLSASIMDEMHQGCRTVSSFQRLIPLSSFPSSFLSSSEAPQVLPHSTDQPVYTTSCSIRQCEDTLNLSF